MNKGLEPVYDLSKLLLLLIFIITMPRAIYPSDITREQFEAIRPQLEAFKKITKPRQIDLYDVFCAVLYVLTSASQWRMLPSDYPKWTTVYAYFRQWKHKPLQGQDGGEAPLSLLETLCYGQVTAHREANGRKAETTFIIVDAQSVKNTDTADEKGYDGGKKVPGIKRHIAVDSQGLPHAVWVTTANVTDRGGPCRLFPCIRRGCPVSRTSWWTAVTPGKPLPTGSNACWAQRSKWPSAVNCTRLP